VSTAMHCDPTTRHDFVYLFDVSDGNPNGDPDAGNLPRVDPETMQGLVTDVAIKRKVRDWVNLMRGAESRYKIYVENSGVALNTKHQYAYDALDIKSTGTKQKRTEVDTARTWMREQFYDVRTFGAVMTTGVNCGQVRGPLQLTFARSIDQIVPLDLSITRVAITDPKDAEVVEKDDGTGKGGKVTEMGRKALVPYALYRGYGFFTPHFAKGDATGNPPDPRLGQGGAFTEQDLALFWDALQQMWDADHSASRGMLALRGLYIFSHENPRGNAPAHRLFERVQVARRPAVQAPRAFTDYVVTIDDDSTLPPGVTLKRLVDDSRVPSAASASQRAF